MDITYKVIYTGEVKYAFDQSAVTQKFAELFNITEQKASEFLIPNKVIKKGLPLNRATVFKAKLEKIGMVIKLENQQLAFNPAAHLTT